MIDINTIIGAISCIATIVGVVYTMISDHKKK